MSRGNSQQSQIVYMHVYVHTDTYLNLASLLKGLVMGTWITFSW